MTNNFRVNLKKEVDTSYDIVFSENVAKEFSGYFNKKNFSKVLFVIDTNIEKLHYENFISQLDLNSDVQYIVIPSGEQYKDVKYVLDICKQLMQGGFNRNDCLVGFGGGVIGDMAGFAAAVYKRGMNVIQIPTTLLSMLDSSVGGKTGVDFGATKNIIGAFKQPKRVFIDSSFLKTLPEGEILSGYFEGLKHSLLDSRGYYEEFKKEGEKLLLVGGECIHPLQGGKLNNIISRNVSVKASIVIEDETEMGVRKFLNYGHTFGHALESVADFKLSHGVCVGFGMLYVNILSNVLGFLDDKDLHDINAFIYSKLLLQEDIQEGSFEICRKALFKEIYSKMLNDKKNVDANISFTLLDTPGVFHIEKIGPERKEFLEQIYNSFISYILAR